MIPVISLLVILSLSLLITRIAATALVHTGISKQMARFQARSAFTGVGFTTSEAEQVVNHPLRRRIIMLLMLLGNAGIVTSMTSLMLTFLEPSETNMLVRVAFLVGGVVVLWIAASSKWLEHKLHDIITAALARFTKLDIHDYQSLLHVSGDYGVAELRVDEKDWIANKTLAESKLPNEGVIVLGITKPDGSYVGAPMADTEIEAGDVLIVYGQDFKVKNLDIRRRGWEGDYAHNISAASHEETQRQLLAAQQAQQAEEAPGHEAEQRMHERREELAEEAAEEKEEQLKAHTERIEEREEREKQTKEEAQETS
jgi:hypothetical protein